MSSIYILAAHILFVSIYITIWKRKNTNNNQLIMRFIFALFMPVVGFLLFLFIPNYGRNKQIIKEVSKNGDNENNLEKFGYLNYFDKENEINKIPMQEALNMNDFKLRRKMIMDTLKNDDVFEYLDVLKEAMNNEDTETSHYATAVILEMQKKVNNVVQALEYEYKSSSEKSGIIKKLEVNYEKIIFSNLYDERNTKRYCSRYKEISDEIFKGSSIEEKYYLNRIRVDFKTKDYLNAGVLCEEYKKKYPESEDMVLCNIKYCVLSKNRKQLDKFFDELKQLPVKLTVKSLEYIRFFNTVNEV